MIYNLSENNSIANRFIAELRDVNVQNDRMRFRRNLERLGEVMAYEISQKLNYQPKEVETPLGVAKVKREGSDISLITYGWQVMHCLNAAEELAKEGISAEVIDLRTLLPLDYDCILGSVEKTGRALVVHAATEFCGLGAEIASTLNEQLFGRLEAPASRFGAAYAPIAYSKTIETAQIPHAGTIAARVRELMK